ncbi:MAG: cytochrome C biogenesis protein [Candidatus Schekmanbacteria bacterium RIFCSPHIGHO2_02_FULL_38_11]|nr:MAG: cytochrome C biogenesis protein [Candidatus Schekmanbacteria bacterium GWA2_38_9]OGL50577.1 MAG: cytochrome C biogenesis protein [Candidatus Schekmanbacteria bacterium RIFCSPLOWO2_02_FULL_38_14]OGL52927.1 MAG: cytochrome C biogenesis protein [Candidatus Schekmanbacteria bacterium RIFCSPHIGHO2_02_FULL_38_11]
MNNNIEFITAFAAGIFSFISPCVLPLIPAYISFISGISMEEFKEGVEGKKNLNKVTLNSIFFIAGFSIVFVVLGASATIAGKFLLSKLSLFTQLAGIIIIIFGLHTMGIFRIRFLDIEKRINVRKKTYGIAGSFFVGFAFAFGWTPCIGPILGAILALASTRDTVLQGILLLSVYSLGLGIPFLITAIAMNTFLKLFKSIKKHFRKIEIISGLLLVIIGLLIFSNNLQILAYYIPWKINI